MEYQKKFGVEFAAMAKTEIYGKNNNPLYTYLMKKTKTNKISWNFGKFLINNNGDVLDYYGAAKIHFDTIELKIMDLIANPN